MITVRAYRETDDSASEVGGSEVGGSEVGKHSPERFLKRHPQPNTRLTTLISINILANKGRRSGAFDSPIQSESRVGIAWVRGLFDKHIQDSTSGSPPRRLLIIDRTRQHTRLQLPNPSATLADLLQEELLLDNILPLATYQAEISLTLLPN